MKKKDYSKSHEIFEAYKNRNRDEHGRFGQCQWEIEHENFELECWILVSGNVRIFQIWPDGKGFTEWKILH